MNEKCLRAVAGDLREAPSLGVSRHPLWMSQSAASLTFTKLLFIDHSTFLVKITSDQRRNIPLRVFTSPKGTLVVRINNAVYVCDKVFFNI